MCGIFGTVTQERNRPDMGILRSLALINRSRGKESLGFFDSTGSVFKKADDPEDVLGTEEATKWLDRSGRKAWAVCGHTRYSTQGTVCDENSHPFKYGSVIGAHNGIVSAPAEYTVDSEYLVDLIDKSNNNYQQAFADQWGYWTFCWLDTNTNEFYITMHDNSCGIVKYNGAWYFSSDPAHLTMAVGARDMYILEEGNTVKFTENGEMVWLENFTASTGKYKKSWKTSGGNSYSSYEGGYESHGVFETSDKHIGVNDGAGQIGRFDAEYREIWEEYIATYEGQSTTFGSQDEIYL